MQMRGREVIRRAGAAVLGAAVAGLGLTAVAGPAAAKGGPMGVSVAQGGGVPVELADQDGSASELAFMNSLAEDVGLYQALRVDGAVVAQPPTDELGPSLTIVWEMYDSTPGDGDAPQIVQTLFPLASGGPVVHTSAGQVFFGGEETPGGWLRAPEQVVFTLETAGVVAADPPSSGFVLPPPDEPATEPPAPDAPSAAPGGDPWWQGAPGRLGIAVVAAFAAAGVSLAAVSRRRRRALTVPG
jgi:hypothetical protein